MRDKVVKISKITRITACYVTRKHELNARVMKADDILTVINTTCLEIFILILHAMEITTIVRLKKRITDGIYILCHGRPLYCEDKRNLTM